jgi:hypothetical protein
VADADGQTFIVLFLVALPATLCLWPLALVGAGVVMDMTKMPRSFRLAASVLGADRAQGPSAKHLAGAAFCLCVANFVPIGILVRNPYGPLSLVAALAYLSIVAAWIARTGWVIRHTGDS